jgi:hypothetical protein
MATAAHHLPVGVRFGSAPSRTGTPWVSMLARMRGPWLDRELATGIEPWRSPVHCARSLQITSPRARRALARSLEQILTRADAPARPGELSAAVPLNDRAVQAARLQMLAIAAQLRDGEPVNTRGVAALRDAISDGSGPFYNVLSGDSLVRMLAGIEQSLDVRD